MIKSIVKLSFLSLVTLSFITVNAVAQNKERKPEKRIEKKVEHLKDKLNLSEEQTAEIKTIYIASEKKNSELRKQLMESHKSSQKEIENVLNDDQKKVYTDMKKEQFKKKEKFNKRNHLNKHKSSKDRKSMERGLRKGGKNSD